VRVEAPRVRSATQLYVDQNINCMNDGRRRAPAVRDAYDALLALMPKE